MDTIIAYCGLNCAECPALRATQKDDDNERKIVAEEWAELYNADIKPEDINCEGCLSEQGRVFKHCYVCEIRNCAKEKAVKNCAYCDDYECKKLSVFFSMAPAAKANLEEIRKSL